MEKGVVKMNIKKRKRFKRLKNKISQIIMKKENRRYIESPKRKEENK